MNYDFRDNTQDMTGFDSILKLNIGKKVVVWLSFPNSESNHDQTFEGTIVATGVDHLVLKLQNDETIILPSFFINYVRIPEDANYDSTFFKRAV